MAHPAGTLIEGHDIVIFTDASPAFRLTSPVNWWRIGRQMGIEMEWDLPSHPAKLRFGGVFLTLKVALKPGVVRHRSCARKKARQLMPGNNSGVFDSLCSHILVVG